MNFFSRQRGLSLIELMIGILLSVLLLMGVLQIFDANRNITRLQNEFARVQESGRFAMDLLMHEIRMADYWGCAPNPTSVRNHLDTKDKDYHVGIDTLYSTNGIQGNDNASGETAGGLDVVDGTDMLILGGTYDACKGTGRMVPSVTAAALHVSPDCRVEPGQIVLISNCQSGELMTITGVQSGAGGKSGKITIEHNTGRDAEGWVRNSSKELQRKYGADARILTPYLRSFFIATNPVGGSSLYVSENGWGAQELVPGIEDMQILYGWDSDGDDAVDIWGPAVDDAATMKKALDIKVQLLVASGNSVQTGSLEIIDLDGETTEYADGKLRKIYLSSAKVRNRGEM